MNPALIPGEFYFGGGSTGFDYYIVMRTREIVFHKHDSSTRPQVVFTQTNAKLSIKFYELKEPTL